MPDEIPNISTPSNTNDDVESGLKDRALLDAPDDESTDDDTKDKEDKVPDLDEPDSDSSDDDDDEDKDEDEEDETDKDEENLEDKEGEDKEGKEDDVDDTNVYQKVKRVAPDLLKKIPELRTILKREDEFSQIFSTPEEAKVAFDVAGVYRKFEADILSGNTKNLLEVVKDTSKESLDEFSHNFLPALQKISPELYGDVLSIPVKRILQAAYSDGRKSGNKNLWASAVYIHEQIFGDQNITQNIPERKSIKKTPEMEKFEKDKQEYEDRKVREFGSGCEEIIVHSLKAEIRKAIKDLKLSDYERKNLVDDIFTDVDSTLAKDVRHNGAIKSLSAQAKSAGFTSEWKSRVVKAYLNNARRYMDKSRRKILSEAGVKVKDTDKEVTRLVPTGRVTDRETAKYDFSKVDKSKTSDMDLLNDRPKLKK